MLSSLEYPHFGYGSKQEVIIVVSLCPFVKLENGKRMGGRGGGGGGGGHRRCSFNILKHNMAWLFIGIAPTCIL